MYCTAPEPLVLEPGDHQSTFDGWMCLFRTFPVKRITHSVACFVLLLSSSIVCAGVHLCQSFIPFHGCVIFYRGGVLQE